MGIACWLTGSESTPRQFIGERRMVTDSNMAGPRGGLSQSQGAKKRKADPGIAMGLWSLRYGFSLLSLLCARFFFQPFDDTGNAVLGQHSLEVDQQTKAPVRQPI
jgi:hypothetical protein